MLEVRDDRGLGIGVGLAGCCELNLMLSWEGGTRLVWFVPLLRIALLGQAWALDPHQSSDSPPREALRSLVVLSDFVVYEQGR